ncbi:MAG: ABC transporter substrate-binding protein [Candidatus Omnitrophica bacterium]|nr:ABC transporter substrate-binding protein [Candidatus Omnitrophota bacterium]
MTIRFGHSPDPDDAFMFYAIAKNKIDLAGFKVIHVVEDIESLNQRALHSELEVTAVSVHAYAYLSGAYAILRSGASIGEKYGPIVVSTKPFSPKELRGKKIAIPGTLTTANLALRLFEKGFSYVLVPFDKILDYVKDGKADAGLVIHEGQLTYREKGLHKVMDLGEWWWEKTHLPLPLGIDVIRKDLGGEKMKTFAQVFKNSIIYSLEHRKEALDYAMPYGRDLTRSDGDQFIGMYVNDYTRDLGQKGEEGIRELLVRGFTQKLLPRRIVPEFV